MRNKIYLVVICIIVSIIITCKSTTPSNPYDPGFDLPAPTNFSVEQTGITTTSLTWTDNAEGEQGYKIDRKVDNGSWVIGYAQVGENILQINDLGLTPEETYSYRIYTYAGENTSTSQEQSIELDFPNPSNFTINQDDVHSFILKWNYSSTWPEGYKIDRKIDSGSWENELVALDVNTKQWTDNSIGRSYNIVYYRVYAYYLDYISKKIEVNSDIDFPPPSSLTINQTNPTTCKLEWQDNSSGEQGFYIDRKINDGSWILDYATVGENIEIYTNSGLIPDNTYSYRVCAYYGDNNTPGVEESISIVFYAPTNLSIEQTGDTSCKLTWDDNSSGEQGFKIDRKVNSGSWSYHAQVGGNVEEHSATGLTAGNSYTYRVYAYYQSVETDCSNEVNIDLDEPLGSLSGYVREAITQNPIQGAHVEIGSWSAITNLNGYYLITDITPGSYTVVCSARYYISQSETVEVNGGETASQNFILSYSTEILSYYYAVEDAIGLINGGTMIVAVRFTSDELADYYENFCIKQVALYIWDLPTYAVLKIWEGGNYGNPGSVVYSENITSQLSQESWIGVNLSELIDLVSQKEYWVGYEVIHEADIHPAGSDIGPVVDGKGDWIYINDTWDELQNYGFEFNWAIKAILMGNADKNNNECITKNYSIEIINNGRKKKNTNQFSSKKQEDLKYELLNNK